jgi:hypothetical protein
VSSEGCGPKKKPRQNPGGPAYRYAGGKAYLLVAQCNTVFLRFAQGKSSLLAQSKEKAPRGRGHVRQALILKRASASRSSGEWNNDEFDVLALRPAVTVLPLRHFARQNCALGEDAISCTACLAHEGTKPRRSIKRRDFRDGSHCSGASAASRFGCNSHSVCPLELGGLIGLILSAAQRINW